MKKIILIVAVITIACLSLGCVSKLVKIDSNPAFADIWINDSFVGKTPVYVQFTDSCYPWPIKKSDDYVVKANLEGYDSEVKVFLDSPPLLDISYVPDEIYFTLHAIPAKDLIK